MNFVVLFLSTMKAGVEFKSTYGVFHSEKVPGIPIIIQSKESKRKAQKGLKNHFFPSTSQHVFI
jgi:hypothetical protein